MDHFEHVFAHSRDAIGLSRGGVHILVNPAYLRLFGYESAGELIGRPIVEMVAPSSRGEFQSYVAARWAGRPAPTIYEIRGLRRDGSEFDAEFHVARYTVEDAAYTVASIRDVTERNRVARELRESEQKFRLLAEQGLLGVAIMQDERLVFVNRELADMFEYTPEEMLGWKAVDFGRHFHADDVAYIVTQMKRKLRGEPADARYAYRGITRSGRVKWMEVLSKRIEYEGAPALLISNLDITARRAAEAEREALAQALQQAQKMEAIGRLAGGIAHDFNNLLTVIEGNLAVVREALPSPSEYVQALDDAEAAARRAAALTSQLLAFSRKQVIAPRPIDVNDTVSRLESMLRRLIGANVKLVVRCAPGRPYIQADPTQLEQVIVNLVVNARDALPGSGTIVVEVEEVIVSAHERPLAALEPGPWVRLSVEDDGVGMSEEVQRRMFEPFFTTKPKGKGTGLGLAMVFGAVTQNRGHITARSAPDRGTRFDLWFPRTESAARRSPDVVEEAPRGRGERILLVEDEAALRKLAARILQELGYEVIDCEDAEHALAAVEGLDRPVDLLFTDVIMPGLNGKELAARLTERQPGLRVLFSSGYSGDHIGAHDLLGAGVDFLPKPYERRVLARRVRAVLDRRAPATGSDLRSDQVPSKE